jgi:hypothetical protein
MGRMPIIAAIAAALTLTAGGALAKPANPGEMADSWLLQSHGQTLCQLKLSGTANQAGVLGAQIPADCGSNLPAGATGWKPTDQGLALVAADGSVLMNFHRWSESLYVSSAAGGGPDLQLSRAH